MSSTEPKSKKKKNNKTTTKNAKANKAAAWGGFINISIITVIFLWILFPFYSWQLQLIFDQAKCMDSSNRGCPLPYNKDAPPYCPTTSSAGCKETIDGPDMFTKIIDFFTHTLRQIYEIITGTIWIEVDKKVRQMEKVAKNKQSSESSNLNKSSKKLSQEGGGVHAASRRGFFNDVSHQNPYGAAVDMAEKALKTSIGLDSKTSKNAQCCSKLLQWEDLNIEKKCETSFSIFDIEPFKSLLPKEFGWPYSYLFDNPKKDADGSVLPGKFDDTKYDPNGTASQSTPNRWIGAWFAKTQQRSWSASRGIWSNILMLFYPFINEELDNIEVELRIQNFIDAIGKQEEKIKNKNNKKAQAVSEPSKREGIPMNGGGIISKQSCSDECLNELSDIKINFEKIFTKFKSKFRADDGKNKDGKTNIREKLYQTIDGLNYFTIGQSKAVEAYSSGEGKQAKGGKPNPVDNIYLDFFVAATKPPEHGRRKSGKDNNTSTISFFNPFGGDERYWMRYLVTLFIPMLTMIMMVISIFTGFWFTAFSSVNRYSNFILPFFGGIWISLFNMFAQPSSVLMYMLFGAGGKHNDSKNCPYGTGVYHMRKNMSQYFALNMFITLAIIVTHLGFALTASGSTGVGIALSLIFPIYIGITLLTKLFYWLWNLA